MELLIRNGVTAVADVRSSPFSRHNPQFNREVLQRQLKIAGLKYVYLGSELGARSDDPACYEGGKIQYGRLANTVAFNAGIDRVVSGANTHRIALMCAEKEPLDCHRTILIARVLVERGLDVQHILANGTVEQHGSTMKRLMQLISLPEQDMFKSADQILKEAYSIRAEQIAYDRTSSSGPDDAVDGESTQ
jgi:uncharacterized protein (DUF488 family)